MVSPGSFFLIWIRLFPDFKAYIMVCSSTIRPGRAMVCLGAEHTIVSGLPLTRESGFFISAWRAKPGSVLAIQDPYGESGRPDLRQVFKYPALACLGQARQRPRTSLHRCLGDAMRRYCLHTLSVLRGGAGV